MVFLYDVSAEHSAGERERWRAMADSVRGSEQDAVLLSLFVDRRDVAFVVGAGFDGAYTYFASDGFTQGSTSSNWGAAREALDAEGKMFLLSVGPGYNDTLIRPWNGAQTKSRREGEYYDKMWDAALSCGATSWTITSWNEWGEGTQIQEARPHRNSEGWAYADYGQLGEGWYVERTRYWAEEAKRTCALVDDEL